MTSMIKRFEKFTDLIEWKNKCPVCSNNLIYKVTTNTFTKSGSGSIKSISSKISKHFEKAFGLSKYPVEKENIVTCSFKPNEIDIISFPEVEAEFRLKENRGLVADFDAAMCLFELTIYCPHDGVGNGYEAKGSFDFQMDLDVNNPNAIPKIDDKLVFEFDNIKIDYELYKIVNIHLEDEKPNGNFIKIINDFYIGKTSFSIAEVNLDGTMGTWKEKRIDLVNDNFFKFESTEKIYSRINTIFLLK